MNADAPLPEYPRPQMVRSEWTNLNGRWDYAITARGATQPTKWDGKIIVPFAVQSQLSGVERAVSDSQELWYHRSFRAPLTPKGGRVLLHFGGVDWETVVYVNGRRVNEHRPVSLWIPDIARERGDSTLHRGGYDPFTIDITDALKGTGDQQIVIRVWDPTDKGPQPRGKQVLKPGSIWYTAVTGIWQTVWLEPVPAIHISDVTITPDIDAGTVRVGLTTAPALSDGFSFNATVLSGGKIVARATGQNLLLIHIPNPHLWSPTDPFLYDVTIAVSTRYGRDTVRSYFGMRKISVARDSTGINRLFLNNKPLFQYGTLDQGWWPDGLYTAPTDEALKFDIEATKRLGFNMIRKHVKVEPARWYYYADKIGMLVWQDMPSGDNNTADGKKEYESELHNMIDALRNHPSIVMWVPFNEGWGQHETEKYVSWIKDYDPSRLVNNASGWTDKKVGDVSDIHVYPGPGVPQLDPNRAAVLGEFGGLGLPLADHTWLDANNWGYRSFTSQQELGDAYKGLIAQLHMLIGDGLSAAVYTQTTDVEIEVNGLMTYDRAITKLPADAIAAAATLWQPPPRVHQVLPTSQLVAQPWSYTTTAPAANWFAPSFLTTGWQNGPGGFGTQGTPGAVVRTEWNTPDIWIRRAFTLDSKKLVNPYWRIHHDEDAEVYLNGALVAKLSGYTAGYVRIPFDAKALQALAAGSNTIAVHVHQTRGGQYIDVGIDEVIEQ